jgi:ribosomal protein S6--L-glutamate ligase
MVKIGIVGTRNGWSSEKLADTVFEKTGFRLLVEMERVRLDMPSGRAWFLDQDLSKLDGLIIKKVGGRYSSDLLDRLEILRFLHERGLKIFSSPYSVLRVLDRLSCTITLQLNGVPMPPTTVTEDVEQACRTVEQYEEAIFKPLYTSKARGMRLIRKGAGARTDIEKYHLDNPIMYIQKKIELGGRDLGLVFLGGRYLTTYARCNAGNSWNTSTFFGGQYEAYDPAEAVIELAHKAQSLFQLDFTCVDIAETAEGPMVFEVSPFGGFRGIQEARGIDAAMQYVQYVLRKVTP